MNKYKKQDNIDDFFLLVEKVQSKAIENSGDDEFEYMESIQIAMHLQKMWLEEEKNQILRRGLNVATNDQYPSALEAIAMALGYK